MDLESAKVLLEKWQKRIRAAHKAHYAEAEKLERRQKILGTIIILLSGVISTSFITNWSWFDQEVAKNLTAILSLIMTFLAGTQSFFNYSEKRTAHLMTSTQLSSIKKSIEEKVVVCEDEAELKKVIKDVRANWDAITQGAPLISEKVYNKEFSATLNDEDFEV